MSVQPQPTSQEHVGREASPDVQHTEAAVPHGQAPVAPEANADIEELGLIEVDPAEDSGYGESDS